MDGGGNIGGVEASINSAVATIATAQEVVSQTERTVQKINHLVDHLLSLKISAGNILGAAQTLLHEANVNYTRAKGHANFAQGNMSDDVANHIISTANAAKTFGQDAVTIAAQLEVDVNNFNSLTALLAVPSASFGPPAGAGQD